MEIVNHLPCELTDGGNHLNRDVKKVKFADDFPTFLRTLPRKCMSANDDDTNLQPFLKQISATADVVDII